AHWAFLSDTHIPADRENEYRGFRPQENLRKVVPQVVEAQPGGVVIDGDLARLEGLPGDYEVLRTLIEPLTGATPVCMALGNHDERKNFLTAFERLGGPRPQDVVNRHVLTVDASPVRLVILDSLLQVNVTPGLLGKAQRQWLETYLRSADDTPILLFVHHTLDDKDGSLLDTDRFFRIITPQRKVKAVVYGHSHRYHYDTLEGIHLINLPAVGYNFADSEPVGWVETTMAKDGGDFKLHAIGGNRERDGQTKSLNWRS
ncbi:MAG: metallophosphoesterase family protein, partial [Bryobacteraceae bacterium]